MPTDIFTHTFKFEINGSSITGECEFNTDGETSFKLTDTSDAIRLDIFSDFTKLFQMIEDMNEKYKLPEGNGVNKIIIKKKGV
jgi:hypothetical protein